MGGDDLASDDEFLFESGAIQSLGGRGTAVGDNSSGSDDDSSVEIQKPLSKKRKGSNTDNDQSISNDELPASSSSKKQKKNDKNNGTSSSSKNILIEAGRGIAKDGAESQAIFIGTLYTHFMKITGGPMEIGGQDDLDNEENDSDNGEKKNEKKPFHPEKFIFKSNHFYSTGKKQAQDFHPTNLATYLKSGSLPSMKRLKNWKHPNSPMVLVLTLSARRSVELMKQLSTLRLPIAKLFAKHMSVDDQVELLSGGIGKKDDSGGGGKGNKGKARCYGIGVGTPGRLLTLLRHGRNESGDGGGALKLNHTEVIILDCQEDSKGFTVCTLKDTSKELMEFMKEGFVPELEKRAGKIKLAMF